VDSFTPRTLYSQGKSPWYLLDRSLGRSQSRSGRGGEEKNSQPLPELEPLITQRYTTDVQKLNHGLISARILECHQYYTINCTTKDYPEWYMQLNCVIVNTRRKSFNYDVNYYVSIRYKVNQGSRALLFSPSSHIPRPLYLPRQNHTQQYGNEHTLNHILTVTRLE